MPFYRLVDLKKKLKTYPSPVYNPQKSTPWFNTRVFFSEIILLPLEGYCREIIFFPNHLYDRVNLCIKSIWLSPMDCAIEWAFIFIWTESIPKSLIKWKWSSKYMFTFALLKNPCWVYRWFGSIKVQIEVIAQFVSNDMIVGERGRKINRLSVT